MKRKYFLCFVFVLVLVSGILAENKNIRKITLTFDDGANPTCVLKILDVLNNPPGGGESVKAMFFCNGDWAGRNKSIIKKIRDEGHFIGNHTKSHPHLTSLSDEEIKEEILGGLKSTLLRPPYGDYNSRVERIANELGYKIFMWDIDTKDWAGTSTEKIIKTVMSKLQNGSVVLMHLQGKHTLEAIKILIPKIRKEGYQIGN